ncbi:MAG TPA: alpha-L-fucosidase, partial [Longimicrobiales bacterium]|nr:alpha-L-fucosidase [Longimicrobiales bacterium]
GPAEIAPMWTRRSDTLSRRDFLATAATVAMAGRGAGTNASREEGRERPVPSPPQLRWQRDERALFIHFGMNTFTGREWGDGTEDPALFAPEALDARQWARAARAGGFRAMILTAKHHDGFCLWPSRTTDHTVAASPWRGGEGDVVREFVDACRAEGLRAGLYLSPWDRHEPTYGDSPRYDDVYCDQLRELLTGYGSIHEVWFDGAHGDGPGGRRQAYDWPRYWGLVRQLQPGAVIFSDAGPDVRWIGNERGVAGETNWSTVDPAAVPFPGATGPGVTEMLQHGDPNGTVWRPGETDVSIRPGWFHHPDQDGRVRATDDLVELVFTSVGRNSKLLLNVPPTPRGLLHPTDVARLRALRDRLDTIFAEDLAATGRSRWRPGAAGGGPAVAEVDPGRSVTVSVADLREDITRGQAVARYTLEGLDEATGWQVLSRGTTIGYRKLDRFAPTTLRRARLRVESRVGPPGPVRIGLYR